MTDKARQQTDKKLTKLERDIATLYRTNDELLKMQREYDAYMEYVQEETQDAYDAYDNESDSDKKEELRQIYVDEVSKLTINNRDYKKLVKKITKAFATVNQLALDMTNSVMAEIYAINYNQVAVDCRKVGIEVNG